MKTALALALLFGACESPADDDPADGYAGRIEELDPSDLTYEAFESGVYREPDCIFVIDPAGLDDPCPEPPARDCPLVGDGTRDCPPAEEAADELPA